VAQLERRAADSELKQKKTKASVGKLTGVFCFGSRARSLSKGFF
jgi:hypothetical protein